MDKKIITLLLVFLIFVFVINLKFLLVTITGFISDILTIGLSITESTSGEFIYFSYPSQVTQESPANFEVIFENTGSMNVTVAIEIHVKDSSLNTVSSHYDESYILFPLELRNFSATWTPTTTGTYWVIANASYNSTIETKTTEINTSFTVVSKEEAAAAPVGVGVGPAGPSPAVTVYNLTLEYPESLNLTINESSIIPIYATNYGSDDLHNLLLSVSVEKIEWEVRPKNVSILPINTTATFFISVRIPHNTQPKNYTLDFTLKSDETTEKGQVIVIVYPIDVCSEVKRAIRNYGIIIDKVASQIEKAAAEGRNISSSLRYLENARKELDLAKELYELRECEEAKYHLEFVREYLEQAIIELARSIKPRFRYIPLTFFELLKLRIWWVIGITIILIILIIVIITLLIKREKIKFRIKPMILTLSEDREKHRKELKDIKKSYLKKQISKRTYDLKRSEIERKIEKIEEQILTGFGSERQLAIFKDMKKAYTEEIISKEIYNKTRGKLVDDIISEKKPRR